MYQLINTADDLNQKIKTVVSVDGRNISLSIKLRWYDVIGLWLMTVYDEEDNVIVSNVPLLAGESFPSANLIRQIEHKGFGSAAIVALVANPTTENPGEKNLGVDKEFALLWGDTDAE